MLGGKPIISLLILDHMEKVTRSVSRVYPTFVIVLVDQTMMVVLVAMEIDTDVSMHLVRL